MAWFRDNRLLTPESDDPDDVSGGARRRDATATADGYATATVTTSSSTSTGGGGGTEEVIEAYLTLTGLTRSDLHTELTCRAWNYFYDDEEYSIAVTNSGAGGGGGTTTTAGVDNGGGRIVNADGEVDPSRWTIRQRQSSLTAVVHVDMNCEYKNKNTTLAFINTRGLFAIPPPPSLTVSDRFRNREKTIIMRRGVYMGGSPPP